MNSLWSLEIIIHATGKAIKNNSSHCICMPTNAAPPYSRRSKHQLLVYIIVITELYSCHVRFEKMGCHFCIPKCD